MYFVTAHAIRYRTTVEVTVAGFLTSSCYEASIKDIYPGGNIMYIKDPGSAQVFIEEKTRPNIHICTMQLVPWIRTVNIPDDYHEQVEIIINNVHVLVVDIAKMPIKFIVVQLTGGIVLKGGFSIIPEGKPYPAIYTQVYGPESYQLCEKWVREHSDDRFPILDSFELGFVGGSGVPRGFAEDGNLYPRSVLLEGEKAGKG